MTQKDRNKTKPQFRHNPVFCCNTIFFIMPLNLTQSQVFCGLNESQDKTPNTNTYAHNFRNFRIFLREFLFLPHKKSGTLGSKNPVEKNN